MWGAVAMAAGAALALATSLLLRRLVPNRGVLASILSIWLLCFGQIVLISEILSEFHALGRTGILAAHVLLFVLVLILFLRTSGRRLAPRISDAGASMWAFLRESRVVQVFVFAVGLLAVANLAFPFLYPPLNGDANAYHLPRAYYWIQLASARHFPSIDFRMTELPPNASFTFAWILALSGRYSGLHVPQWTAGIAMMAATAALARLAGASRAIALVTGALVLTWPLTVLQMASSQTDLVVAAASACAVYFGLRAALSTAHESPGDIAYFGLAFGLAMGTKLTFGFLVPALGIGLSAVAIFKKRPGTMRRLFFAAAVGFAAFGAYNYALNLVEFGNPIASRQAFGVLRIGAPWQHDHPANALRYLHQMLDWPGLVTREGSIVVGAEDAVFSSAARLLGRDASVGDLESAFRRSRWMPDEELSGIGPIGFLVVLVSPAILALALRDFRRSRQPTYLIEASLILMAVGWSVAFLVSAQPWTGQLRFFLVALPLAAAGVVPRLTSGRGRTVILTAICGIAVVVAAAVTFSGSGGIRRGDYRRSDFDADVSEEVVSWWKVHLPEMYPEGATLGLAPEFNDALFHLFRSLPRFRFLPVAEEEIPAGIARGLFEGALTGQFRNPSGQGVMRAGRPLPRSFLHPTQPAAFFRLHPDQYRLRLIREGDALVAVFAIPEGLAWDAPSLDLHIPTALVTAVGSPAVLILTADRPLGRADEVAASCGMPGTPMVTSHDGAEVRVVLWSARGTFIDLRLSRSGAGPPATFRAARLVAAAVSPKKK